jgi:hypothetical protein
VDPKDAPDGYYIVQWTGEPEVLQKPTKVEGYNAGLMPEGTVVCKGQYYNRVPRNPRWYQIGDEGYKEETHFFRLQNVLDAEVEMEPHHERNGVTPTAGSLTEFQQRMAEARCFRVPIETHQQMVTEKRRRAAFDMVECTYETEGEEDSDDENMEDPPDESEDEIELD